MQLQDTASAIVLPSSFSLLNHQSARPQSDDALFSSKIVSCATTQLVLLLGKRATDFFFFLSLWYGTSFRALTFKNYGACHHHIISADADAATASLKRRKEGTIVVAQFPSLSSLPQRCSGDAKGLRYCSYSTDPWIVLSCQNTSNDGAFYTDTPSKLQTLDFVLYSFQFSCSSNNKFPAGAVIVRPSALLLLSSSLLF